MQPDHRGSPRTLDPTTSTARISRELVHKEGSDLSFSLTCPGNASPAPTSTHAHLYTLRASRTSRLPRLIRQWPICVGLLRRNRGVEIVGVSDDASTTQLLTPALTTCRYSRLPSWPTPLSILIVRSLRVRPPLDGVYRETYLYRATLSLLSRFGKRWYGVMGRGG